MAPTGTRGAPSEKLSSAIDAAFGSMDDFKAEFCSGLQHRSTSCGTARADFVNRVRHIPQRLGVLLL